VPHAARAEGVKDLVAIVDGCARRQHQRFLAVNELGFILIEQVLEPQIREFLLDAVLAKARLEVVEVDAVERRAGSLHASRRPADGRQGGLQRRLVVRRLHALRGEAHASEARRPAAAAERRLAIQVLIRRSNRALVLSWALDA
jgi:hypothetical protein